MKKITQTVLMLCLFLSAAFCYAHGVARTGIPQNEKGDGTPIDISTAAGASVDHNSIHTPNGVAKHHILKQCLSPWRYPLSSSNRWASFSSNHTAFLISTMVCTGITRIAV